MRCSLAAQEKKNNMPPTVSRHDVRLGSRTAHYYRLKRNSSAAPVAHMYHANAYPFGSYKSFLSHLDCEVFGLGHRGTWEDAGIASFEYEVEALRRRPYSVP